MVEDVAVPVDRRVALAVARGIGGAQTQWIVRHWPPRWSRRGETAHLPSVDGLWNELDPLVAVRWRGTR